MRAPPTRRPPTSARSTAALALLVGACAPDPSGARTGLLLPDAVEIRWEGAYNERNDGLGALVPVDVMVYDGGTGEAVPDVTMHVWTDDAAAMPVAADAVTVLPDAEETLPEADPFAVGAAVESWDAAHDQFVALRPASGLDLRTDGDGIARLYVFVDAFPRGATGGYDPIRVIVATADVDDVFWLEAR